MRLLILNKEKEYALADSCTERGRLRQFSPSRKSSIPRSVLRIIKMDNNFFGTEKISRILFKLAPPVMLAQLIQALYNIVDSLFVAKYSESGLTALSIIFPIQLLMIALAVGTGVGINTIMASKLGIGKPEKADEFAGVGTPLAVFLWAVFSVICVLIMPLYAKMSTNSEDVIRDVIIYGRIICIFSFGLFLESVWTKVHQAEGNMRTPMIAQIVGAIVNIGCNFIFIYFNYISIFI